MSRTQQRRKAPAVRRPISIVRVSAGDTDNAAWGLLPLRERLCRKLAERSIQCRPGQLQRVIYIGSFSKTLPGSVRVGYVAAAPEIAEGLNEMKVITIVSTSAQNERLAYSVIEGAHYLNSCDSCASACTRPPSAPCTASRRPASPCRARSAAGCTCGSR